MKFHLICYSLCLAVIFVFFSFSRGQSLAEEEHYIYLSSGFETPPDYAKPLVWWHWINGNVTKEGIEEDLADMKRVGIAGAQMLDVSIYLPPGPIRYGTDKWHDHVQHAIKTADRLGLEFTMMNGPGWSASGGPWVSPEQSMKKLVWSELNVTGQHPLDLKLPLPVTRLGFYKDVTLIAVPADPIESNLLRSSILEAATAPGIKSSTNAYDGNQDSSVELSESEGGKQIAIDFQFKEIVEISQLDLMLTGIEGRVSIRGKLESESKAGDYKKIAKFNFPDHEGDLVQLQIPFNPVNCIDAKLTLEVIGERRQKHCAISEISLGHPPRLSDWTRLNKMAEKTINRKQANSTDQSSYISTKQVYNLTENLDENGRVRCTLPKGRWTLIRFGYTSTGSMNHPAVPEGHGLEIDKLDSAAVAYYFDQALARVIREAGPLAGNAFGGILFDSFEGGMQNWTETFPEQFSELKGYELIPYLPVITGRILESPTISEAFLYDFRTAVEELIAQNYFGTMQRLAHQHGLSVYAEAQGGPLNPVSCNEYVDVPMNEFWLPDTSPRSSKIKLISSTANLLGRNVVAAEAFTAKPEDDSWRNSPAMLKRAGDYAFTAGINRYILHYYAHQPVTKAAPGFTLGRYGTHFGRLNTWWPFADAWLDYVARCQYMLQQGETVADVCFLLNEDFGYSYPKNLVDTPEGYDFNICYPRHLSAMKYEDGSIVTRSGHRYKLLVLPKQSWAANISTLEKLHELLEDGAVILGDPPVGPAGIRDIDRIEKYNTLVSTLWDKYDDNEVMPIQGSQGKVVCGLSVEEILTGRGITRDVTWPTQANKGEFKYIHRRTDKSDIYFVFNHSNSNVHTTLTFRDAKRIPELWNPLTGSRVEAPVFTADKSTTSIPLSLEPYGSMFVVFSNKLPERWTESVVSDKPASKFSSDLSSRGSSIEVLDGQLLGSGNLVFHNSDGSEQSKSYPNATHIELTGPWRLKFLAERGAPEPIVLEKLVSWTEHTDPQVKYYSGIAEYSSEFSLDVIKPTEERAIILDLGRVADVADVSVNGSEPKVCWQPPHCLEITDLVHEGPNQLVIRVANQWVNRMIGDEFIDVPYSYKENGTKFTNGTLQELPKWLYEPDRYSERKRITFSTWRHFTKNSPLVDSGLIGPVRVEQKYRLVP